jgi:putative ABC transport system permease protein
MRIEYLKLAVGNLAHRKTRSILTMVGIFIGIAAVISLISLGQGLESAVQSQFSALGSDRLIIQAKTAGFGPPGTNTAGMLTKDDLEVVQRSQYVRVAAGRLIKFSSAEFNGKTHIVGMASMPDRNEDERQVVLEVTKPVIIEGRLLTTNDRYKAMVGNKWVGENRFGRSVKIGDKIKVNNRSIEVVGILERSGNPVFDEIIYLNEEPYRDLLNIPDEYSIITGKTDNEEVVDLAADAVTRDLRRSRGVKIRQEDFTVQTSAQLLESVGKILNVIQAVLIGIAAISLIVGGIGIMNTMYTSTLERTREIGIMKAIGATQAVILSIFLIEAAVLGLIGGAIGVALGIAFAKIVEFIGTYALGPGLLQADISFWLIGGALLFSLCVGIISGLLPAWQASKMEPVEALNA